ncbi:MAG: SAF domain-containing protein [Propionibacteriaceae bacterium]
MTATSTSSGTTAAGVDRPADGRHGAAGAEALVPTPPRARRRWGLFAAMVLVVTLGVLGNVWLWSASTTAREVVAARTTIARGSVIDVEDLMTVRVELDPALQTIAGADLASLVGQRAALDVAAGSLLTSEATSTTTVPGQGYSLVGIGVAPARMPGATLVAGDQVRVVATPQTQIGQVATAPEAVAAVVVSTQIGTDATGQGQTVITVQVPSDDAAGLAALAATGEVAVVLDSRER